jgi:hypothetical protein
VPRAVALNRAARLIGEQLNQRGCVAGPLRSPRSPGGGLILCRMGPIKPFEQRVAIEAQSWPSSFARQPDDTELRLVGVDEVAIDGEQASDLGHGEELAGRSFQELDDTVRDGLDVLMLEGHQGNSRRRATRGGDFVQTDEKPRMIEILPRTMKDTYVSQRLQTTARSYLGLSGSQRPPAGAGSAVVRRACIA